MFRIGTGRILKLRHTKMIPASLQVEFNGRKITSKVENSVFTVTMLLTNIKENHVDLSPKIAGTVCKQWFILAGIQQDRGLSFSSGAINFGTKNIVPT